MQYILSEIVMGGMVLETNMNEIVTQIEAQNKLEKNEVSTPMGNKIKIMSFFFQS